MNNIHSAYTHYLTQFEAEILRPLHDGRLVASQLVDTWCSRRNDYIRSELENHVNGANQGIILVADPLSVCRILDENGWNHQYFLSGVFESKQLIPFVDSRFELLTLLSRKEPESLIIRVYDGSHAMDLKAGDHSCFSPGNDLEAYWSEIENLADGSANGGNSFFLLSKGSYNLEMPYPWLYTSIGTQVRKAIETEETDLLEDVVDIIYSSDYGMKSEGGIVFSTDSYPIDFERCPLQNAVDLQLKKGDIVYGYCGLPMLLDETPPYAIYAPVFSTVLRPRSIQAEYLFLYLRSNIGRYVQLISTRDQYHNCFDRVNLGRIPVIRPTQDAEWYSNLFKDAFYHGSISLETLLAHKNASSIGGNEEMHTLGMLLEAEWQKRLSSIDNTKARELIFADMAEINACFAAKAYKATLILAGSILETFLTDWLGSIHGKNYFVNKYYVGGKEANLGDFIDAIEEIKRPSWMEAATHAEFIREKRNLVHGKLCMKRGVQIDEETCQKVVSYLKEIICTRFPHSYQ